MHYLFLVFLWMAGYFNILHTREKQRKKYSLSSLFLVDRKREDKEGEREREREMGKRERER